MKRLAVLLAALFAVSGSCAFAQGNSGTIEVRVVDTAGKPLSGIPVAVTSRTWEETRVSDKRGVVWFMMLPPDTETVIVGGNGYDGCANFVRVFADQTVRLNWKAQRAGVECPKPRLLNASLLKPGEGADVYDIF